MGADSAARRLRRAQGDDGGASTRDLVLEASRDVRGPLVYGTLIALLAVVPLVVMEGRPGAFFEPLVLAYVLAVLAASVVAATVTPALSLLLFSRGAPGRRQSPLVARLLPRYGAALAGVDPEAAEAAHRGRGLRDRRSRGAAAARRRADPLLQGSRRARAPGRRAGNVEPADDPAHDGGRPRAARGARRRERRRARRARGDRRPDGGRQLERALGEHRLGRRLRGDGQADRGCRRPRAGHRERRRDLLDAADQGRGRARGRRRRDPRRRLGRADGIRHAPGRPRLRPRPVRASPAGRAGAERHGRRRRGGGTARRDPRGAAEPRDRGRSRPRPAVPDQARRRPPRGGHPAPGHPGRQCVRGPEGVRRARHGRARDAPERRRRPPAADRPARRWPRAARPGRRRADRAVAGRHRARGRLPPRRRRGRRERARGRRRRG